MKQYETYELVYTKDELKDNWAQIDLVCEVSGMESKTIKGFYAGNGKYVIRFLPSYVGNYHFKVSGIINDELDVICEKSNNHGMVKAVDTHFEYQDGSLFHPFGTTIYGMMHQGDDLEKETLNTLSNGYFNKIRLCLFPKHYDFNHNEPVYYAFNKIDNKWDVNKPNFEFFDHFEKRIKELNDLNIQVDLILFHPYDRWGFSELGQKSNLIYLDYLLRRFSAFPNIWWSLANEYDLILNKISLDNWYEIEQFIVDNDPYHHLLSNHQCFVAYDWSRKNITHVCSQTKAFAKILPLIKKLNKPAIVDECCYEGNITHFWGSISAKEMVNRFYRMIAQGAYCTHGETYLNDKEILWWSRGGSLVGESPKRIKYLKSIVEEFKQPLVGEYGSLEKFAYMSKEELDYLIKMIPPTYQGFARVIQSMPHDALVSHVENEKEWVAKACDDSIYFTFLDLRTCISCPMSLNKNKKYKVEIIDSWNMTREIVLENVTGDVIVPLKGKEGFAILATEM